MAITTILSDLGNVVVFFDNEKMYRTFAARSGLDPEQVKQALFGFEPGGSYLCARYSSGSIGTRRFRREFLGRLGLKDSLAARRDFERDFCDVFALNWPVAGLWQTLRRRGATLTAISNVEEIRYDWLCRMGVMDLFDHELVSFREKLLKPSEEFMIRALDRSGCAAEEAVFVDDVAVNLEPAAKLGIKTHCYRDFDGLAACLAALGLDLA